MTARDNGNSRTQEETVKKLDSLIAKFFKHINDNIASYTKVGDLLKMIELKNKLLPDSSNQKEFWKMMEQIRKQKLPPAEKPARPASPASRRSREV